MSLSDPIADFLTRLRNAGMAHKTEVLAPYSKIKAEIAQILKQEGYISNYEVDTTGKFPQIKVTTKVANRVSAITGLKRVSKPGLRKYVGSAEIPRVLGGMGMTRDTMVERIFRDVRGFRIYDGPSEVHRWSLGRRIVDGKG